MVPAVVQKLAGADVSVIVQKGAGSACDYDDSAYEQAGAVIADADTVYAKADIMLRVSPPSAKEIKRQKEGGYLIGFLGDVKDSAVAKALRERRLTALAMAQIPRTTRAQAMDALSSQRSVAGYHAVTMAATRYGHFLPMMTGPTGTVRPATVLIIGAGVAGLQAVATARRLGAVVEVSDIRSAAKEQVQSLGARFVGADIKAEGEGGYARELTQEEKQLQIDTLATHVAKAHIVITTAEIPGRPAPRIVSAEMVESMATGSLIIDLAAGSGGNCELTKPGENYRYKGVTIFGMDNPAGEMPAQASDLYAHNLRHLLALLIKEEGLAPDWEDDILAAMVVAKPE